MRLTTRPQGVASLCPGLSHYAPLGLREDEWFNAPTGRKVIAQGNALGSVRQKRIAALKGRNPSARKPTHRCFALCGLGRIDGWHFRHRRTGVGVARAALHYALGYLMVPLWGCGTMNGFMPQRGAR